MPILVPCPVTRRASPAEDYMMTLSGVSSLIDQQQQLLRLFQTNNGKQPDISNNSKGDKHNTSDNGESVGEGQSSHNQHRSHHSLDTAEKGNRVLNTSKDLTRSSSSSMQTIRRILEIEELRKFSDTLESKIDRKFIK